MRKASNKKTPRENEDQQTRQILKSGMGKDVEKKQRHLYARKETRGPETGGKKAKGKVGGHWPLRDEKWG